MYTRLGSFSPSKQQVGCSSWWNEIYATSARRRARRSLRRTVGPERGLGFERCKFILRGQGAVRAALSKITAKLREIDVDYAVAGGLALYHHGLRQFTEVVELLVTRDGLRKLHRNAVGHGYVPAFAGSKHLRETDYGVKIEFSVAGEFPGDGNLKLVAFPHPVTARVESGGIQYLPLAPLIELKLASGMTRPDRTSDLAEIHELIRILNLPAEFAERLNPFVRDKFTELWKATRPTANRYVMICRGTPEPLVLAAIMADGVLVDPKGCIASADIYLMTTDPAVAKKYVMYDEADVVVDETNKNDHQK